MALIYVPAMNVIFKTAPLSMMELVFCLGMSVVVFHAVELEKWMKLRIRKRKALANI
jgi:Ca2+-transporting ATPase